ncbi:adenylosuccinate lyase [Rhodosalinus sp.]|uniref:adenylosuccinate lyase n=1 Tax=Rhodosalinus sp. TaxID=2047741 RepID=UPI00397AC0E7
MTTVKTLVVAAALTVVPAMSMAMCSGMKSDQAVSCADGKVWDSEQRACVEQVMG